MLVPTPRPRGKNKAITRTDVAGSLAKAWAKTKLSSVPDVRSHALLCRAHGDEAAARAFIDLGGDAWWVDLYRDPSPATAAVILSDGDLDGEDLGRLLDVARLVPAAREQALDRFVELAIQRIADRGAENAEIPYGWLAREDLARARALVDANPGLLEYDGGLYRHVRRGATSYVATLIAADYAAAFALAPKLEKDVLQELPSDLYALDLTAAQWIELTRMATTAQDRYGVDWLLRQVAYGFSNSTRANANELMLALYEACEEPPVALLDLLIELGRLDEARALLPKLVDPDPNPNASFLTRQRFILGFDDAEETIGRMSLGTIAGVPAHKGVKFSRGMQLSGLLEASELFVKQGAVDAATMADLEKRRAALVKKGPESQYDRGKWDDFVVQDLALRLRGMAPGAAYETAAKALVAAIKAAPSKRRWAVAAAGVRECAGFDPVLAFKAAKQSPPTYRHSSALTVMHAFLPDDPGGALLALCDLCPKQPSRPSQLVDGTLEILEALPGT
jgi:hypothetical protein